MTEEAKPFSLGGESLVNPAGILGELLANQDTTLGEGYDLEKVHMQAKPVQQWRAVPQTSRLAITGCTGNFLYGYGIALINPCYGYMAWDLGWRASNTEVRLGHYGNRTWMYEALVVWIVFLGTLIGAVSGSHLISHKGRRTLLIFTMWSHIVGALSMVTAGNVSSLAWARFLTGVAVGFSSTACTTYVSEMTPHASRGLFGLINQLCVTLGILAAQLLGLAHPFTELLPDESNLDRPRLFTQIWWRVMSGLPVVLALLSLYGLVRWFPYETPHFYLRTNRYAEAKAVLQRIYNRNDVEQELNEITIEVQGHRASHNVGMRQVMRNPELRNLVLVGCLVAACQQFTGINVFVTSSTEILRLAGWEDGKPYVGSSVIWAANVLFTIVAFWLIQRCGKRKLIGIGGFLMTVSLVPGMLGHWMPEAEGLAKWGSLVGLVVYIASFACSYGIVVWVQVFESFPLEIKGASASLLPIVAHWIACLLTIALALVMTNKWIFVIFTGLNLIIGVLLYIAVPFLEVEETRSSPLYMKPQGESKVTTTRVIESAYSVESSNGSSSADIN